MGADGPLIAAVIERIISHETSRRTGRAFPIELPADAPPLTILTRNAFPPEVLERRERFLRAVGWIDGPVDECTPGERPGLPPEATIEDHVAVVACARRVQARSLAEAALAASLGVEVTGVEPPAVVAASWSDVFDAAADAEAPGWRSRPPVGAGPWPRLEAVVLGADSLFGRRRALPVWPALGRLVGRLGVAKRRWVR